MCVFSKRVTDRSALGSKVAVAALAACLVCLPARAGVILLGTQYVPDQYFPEFDCYWNASAYPGPCTVPRLGATYHILIKNTGAASITIDDTTLVGYNLKTVIKKSTASWNPDELNSIYFYWDDPPADILSAGEPAWYRFDPPTVPAGGVAQVAVRLRKTPTTNPLSVGVVTSAGTVNTTITVDSATPRIASIGYSDDLRKIYLHWSRPGGSGAAPASVWLDGTDVTTSTATVSDPSYNFAASVISLTTPLSYFSYHVLQGVYGDGKTATAGQRAWTNKVIYCTYSTFTTDSSYTTADWLDEASDHGFNNVQMNLGAMGSYLGTSSGRADCVAHGYGYTILDKTKLNALDPDMFFLNDEPDAEELNQGNTHCGTGYKIPCDSSHYPGSLVIKTIAYGESELRSLRPNVPFTVNLDGGEEPESFFTWGPAVDVLQTDNYYDPRYKDAYISNPSRIGLYTKAKLSYAVGRTCAAGAEPNPSSHLLYCNKQTNPDWPYPKPQSKRFEIYYSLAGGSKSIGYWWLNPPNGLNNTDASSLALWKEMGLAGNEIKTARPLIVKSTPVDLTLTPAPPGGVWARGLASGTDTLLLLVVNDNYVNDTTGCHVTNVANATVTVKLPAWMQSSPSAFEIAANGLFDVSTTPQGGGSQLQVNLGTLQLTRMIVITTDATLRAAIQQHYDTDVKPHVLVFAPELFTDRPPTIGQSPLNQVAFSGDPASFNVFASGTSPLSYRWQKNTADLSDDGHYSGCTTATLYISNCDSNDAASYRCVVTNAYGSATSGPGTLTVNQQVFGNVSLTSIPPLSGDVVNEARAISPDAQAVAGISGSRGFLYTSNTVANVISSDASPVQSTNAVGVGYRTVSGQRQIVVSGMGGSKFSAFMIPQGGSGASFSTVIQNTGAPKKPTVPSANGVAGTSTDILYAIWTDEGTGASDNWTLNIGRFSNAWPASVFWAPKAAAKPDTLQLNGIASNGRAVGWRRNGTTLVYANYIADWQGFTTPSVWNFNGLDGTTAGQAFCVSADGLSVFGISPRPGGAGSGSTNYGYKSLFNTTMPGPATQLSLAPLPMFPDAAGSTSLAIPYGCTADGKYAVGMNFRGVEKAVLWDTSRTDPSRWTIVDLTDVAAADGVLGIFTRLSRAYSVGTNSAGAFVIVGAGTDGANTRAFLMTVLPPLAAIDFPPTVTYSGDYLDGFTFSLLSPSNTNLVYYLETATSLEPPVTWTTLGSTRGTGSRINLYDPNPVGGEQFYRVRIQ